MIETGRGHLLTPHRRRGDTIVIISATNDFVTSPIAKRFAVDNLIATRVEILNGRYTGGWIGKPCFQDGKIHCLNGWLGDKSSQWIDQLGEKWFYSDSHNDLPLLHLVDHPIAVNPDDTLRKHAALNQWEIID